jgi:hypothetical protein
MARLLVVVVLALSACGEKGFDYGPLRMKVADLTKRADKNPCDPVAARELVETLTTAGDFVGATARGRAFRAGCKADQKLAEKELETAKRAQDAAYTVEVAKVLVELSPAHAKRHTDLAKALDATNDPGSVVVWRRAFALAPTDPDTATGLAAAQEKAGQACDALLTWRRFRVFHPDRAAEAAPRVEKLSASPGCDKLNARGTVEIAHKSQEGMYVFPVKIGGKDVDLGVDFTSAYTVLTKETAARLGISTEGAPDLTTKTFAGQAPGKLVMVPAIQIGTIKVEPLEVVVVDSLPKGMQGTMGGDVTSRVDLEQNGEKSWKFTAR